METINEDTTKRLSFGDVTQGLLVADPLNVEDVIKAVKSPSVDNFQRYVYENKFRENSSAETRKSMISMFVTNPMSKQFSSILFAGR